jgi:hypothetical protein
MDAEAIRGLRRADPFKPFDLVMDDGCKLPVDKPYYLAFAPDGKLLVHSSTDGGFERFGPTRVRGVDFEVAAAKPATGDGGA